MKANYLFSCFRLDESSAKAAQQRVNPSYKMAQSPPEKKLPVNVSQILLITPLLGSLCSRNYSY